MCNNVPPGADFKLTNFYVELQMQERKSFRYFVDLNYGMVCN